MSEGLQSAFLIICFASGLPLLISSLVGLVIAILQAATQVQEQSLTFVVKLSVVFLLFFAYQEQLSLELPELLKSAFERAVLVCNKR